ncbi:hypothetical protein AALP_AA5G192600 [Arabis alpina]|uniref:Uncharacterized protein n=1 Tax=Arabis alpina TaxID=50452 RepID=A0A087GY27_ARAAL|nr:hypothetical protein AALP_AA5G192600 [Arabis alpina]
MEASSSPPQENPLVILDPDFSPIAQASQQSLFEVDSSDPGWTCVVKRSSPPVVRSDSNYNAKRNAPVTSDQFKDEQLMIQEAQKLLRARLSLEATPDPQSLPLLPTSSPPSSLAPLSAKAKQRQRKRLRQRMFRESQSDSECCPVVSSAVSLEEFNQDSERIEV